MNNSSQPEWLRNVLADRSKYPVPTVADLLEPRILGGMFHGRKMAEDETCIYLVFDKVKYAANWAAQAGEGKCLMSSPGAVLGFEGPVTVYYSK
jgi:hypothetical protein